MFVFIRLLVVDASQSASATMSYGRWSVRASRLVIFAPPRLSKRRAQTWIREYQRRHHPNGPKRRCSIHDRPTCPFSADDGAYAGHWKGPRPVVCTINLRLRRFDCGTGQLAGLNMYYIELSFPKAPGGSGSAVPRPHYRANWAKYLNL